MMKRGTGWTLVLVAVAALAIGYLVGRTGDSAVGAQDVSPTRAMDRDYYVPNSEDLASNEMRVIACGTGMPTTRAAQAALFVGLLFGGLALEAGRVREVELLVFAGLFAAALLCRLVSSAFLATQSERPGLARSHRALGAPAVWKRLREAGSTRVLAYLVAAQGVTYIAAPYFTPYMLGPLALSYAEFMTLTASSFLARMAVLLGLGAPHRKHM